MFYTASSGLLRPVPAIANTFQGRLLGAGADAGSEANGVWSVGTAGNTGDLAGGFGVMHVGDTDRPLPSEDDGSVANSMVITIVTAVSPNDTDVSIADGMLTVKARKFGWADLTADAINNPTYEPLSDDQGANLQISAKFDLAGMASSGGSTVNGTKHIDAAIAVLTKQREQLATLRVWASGPLRPEQPKQPLGRQLRTRCSTTCSAGCFRSSW